PPPSQPNANRRSPHNRNRNGCPDYTTQRDMTQGHPARQCMAAQPTTQLTCGYGVIVVEQLDNPKMARSARAALNLGKNVP
ncbi:hypothetical protein AB0I54_45620, partial [Streptomyces sp. NPDC050625]|uniref:hypothetical protein n=1 Tax=Streptomyces sp. NPDC050625 TaxID=3154629 RepID=UPI00343B97CA